MAAPGVHSFLPIPTRFASLARQACSLALGAVLLALVVYPPPLIAKEKKIPRRVTGAVLDGSENGIPGASVALTDLQTGKKYAKYTGENGLYEFSDLDPHHDYEVQASFKGASSEARKVSSFDTRNKIVLNLRIPSSKS